MQRAALRQTEKHKRPRPAKHKKFKVVRNDHAVSSYPFRLYILFLILISLALFLKVYLMICIARDSIRVESVNQNIEKLEMSNEKIRLDQAQLKAPGRIQKLAVEKLNMVNPQNVNYIYLPEEIIRQDIVIENKQNEEQKTENERKEKVRFIRFLSTVTSRIGVVALGDLGLFGK